MSYKHSSHSTGHATDRDRPAQSANVIDASGMFLEDLRRVVVSSASENNGVITVTNLQDIAGLEDLDDDAFGGVMETLQGLFGTWLAEDIPETSQFSGVTLHQYSTQYDRTREYSGLDARADEHNIAIIRLGGAGALIRPNTSTDNPGRDKGSAFGERWKRMADKQEESHFVREMVKALSPHFDELRQQAEKLDERLTDVNAKLTDQDFALSGVARRLDDYYQQTIQHNQSLEKEIASLRQEMSRSSAKTNALLETIAQSLQQRASI